MDERIWRWPQVNRSAVVATVVSTLLLIVDFYRPAGRNEELERMLLFFVVPALVIVLGLRQPLGKYGFRLGNWRLGLPLTVAAAAALTPIIVWVMRGSAQMSAYYAHLVAGLPWNTFLQLFGWEFTFRGWLLFAYLEAYGEDALWLQAAPFALAHLAKPQLETLTTIFGGFAFGWLAWRSESFLYPFLIHWYLFTLVVWLS